VLTWKIRKKFNKGPNVFET